MQLRQAYYILSGQSATAANVISRFIGGVYVDRSKPGTSETMPYTPVSLADQKRAMKALKKICFCSRCIYSPKRCIQLFGKTKDEATISLAAPKTQKFTSKY